jgi:hypothetical protein
MPRINIRKFFDLIIGFVMADTSGALDGLILFALIAIFVGGVRWMFIYF